MAKPLAQKMDPLLLSRCIAHLTSSPCWEVGDHLLTLQIPKVYSGQPESDHMMSTWMPLHRIPCCFQRLPDGKTVVLMEGQLYYSSPEFALEPSCPEYVVFYGQYTEDKVSDKKKPDQGTKTVPRVLVYDVKYTNEPKMHPWDRYNELRTRCEQYLPKPLCVMQWVGYYSSALEILANKANYPHEIFAVFCLTSDSSRLILPGAASEERG